MPARLERATSPEVGRPPLVLVPVGSIEQHGPHLPLDTDTAIAVAVAGGAARELDAWVAPPLSYGSSGEHQSFAGTSSIGTGVLVHTLVELVRSMRTWAGAVLFVNGHGGNVTALRAAVEQLLDEGHRVGWVACATESDVAGGLHAGRTETSLMLHLRPHDVRLHRAEAGNTQPLSEILPAMRVGGIASVSANGVLGDPAGATPEEGAAVLATMITDVVIAGEKVRG
ncbi:mycofactocin biosynthesis peptidyl-dipeptidase MftE [Nocardioides sp. C4-1]|uniref:mycofactocin biosynthesis peptidyl-dipeptidase MftE n=1 Tax=Nocardioides sp. C4-1 TaxID=3151851 RepID=UPI0032675896